MPKQQKCSRRDLVKISSTKSTLTSKSRPLKSKSLIKRVAIEEEITIEAETTRTEEAPESHKKTENKSPLPKESNKRVPSKKPQLLPPSPREKAEEEDPEKVNRNE
jgi:hypothetical protein